MRGKVSLRVPMSACYRGYPNVKLTELVSIDSHSLSAL